MKLQRIIILALGLYAPALFGMERTQRDLQSIINQLAPVWGFTADHIQAAVIFFRPSFQKRFPHFSHGEILQRELNHFKWIQTKYANNDDIELVKGWGVKDPPTFMAFVHTIDRKQLKATHRNFFLQVLENYKLAKNGADSSHNKELEQVIQRGRERRSRESASQSNVAPPLKPAGNSADAASAQPTSEKPPAVTTTETAITPPSKETLKVEAQQSSGTQGDGAHSAPQPESKAPQTTTHQVSDSITDQETAKTGSGFERFITHLNTYKRGYLIISGAVAVSALVAAGAYWYLGNKKKDTQKKIIAES
jgi:hypothetical protein